MTEINESRKKRRGPAPLDDPRLQSVNVRLNAEEMALLDSKVGTMARAEWMRCAALDKLPVSIPELNRAAYTELSRVSANLNQIAKQLNIDPDSKSWDEIVVLLKAVRGALLGVKLT